MKVNGHKKVRCAIAHPFLCKDARGSERECRRPNPFARMLAAARGNAVGQIPLQGCPRQREGMP